jgi:3D (Asp-Asp-Asp) domain-containing protein
LAEAGIPLLGGDYSLPAENEAVPADGQIKVVRVSESILLAQKPIPFTSDLIASADVPLDQTQVLQPGEPGLTAQRIRIRYEDGVEVSRTTEAETTVRLPQNRVLGYGTRIEIKTALVDGVPIEYWRAVQMYVTSYSPCRSGGEGCSNGTSSGAKVQKGVAGTRYSWYLSMAGQRLYIPGYGFATVADVCGGCVGKAWIDVAYSDNDYVPWSSWVTVYFLTPVPSSILYTLE